MWDVVQDILQFLIDGSAAIVNGLFYWFPYTPFKILENPAFSDYIAKINYFIPIYEFVAIGQTWLVAIALYYSIVVIARWLKVIE